MKKISKLFGYTKKITHKCTIDNFIDYYRCNSERNFQDYIDHKFLGDFLKSIFDEYYQFHFFEILIKSNNVLNLKFLLESGFNINSDLIEDHDCLFSMCLYYYNLPMAKFLLDNGFDIHNMIFTDCEEGEDRNNYKNVFSPNYIFHVLFYFSKTYDDVDKTMETIKFLISNGIDINDKNINNDTALHLLFKNAIEHKYKIKIMESIENNFNLIDLEKNNIITSNDKYDYDWLKRECVEKNYYNKLQIIYFLLNITDKTIHNNNFDTVVSLLDCLKFVELEKNINLLNQTIQKHQIFNLKNCTIFIKLLNKLNNYNNSLDNFNNEFTPSAPPIEQCFENNQLANDKYIEILYPINTEVITDDFNYFNLPNVPLTIPIANVIDDVQVLMN